MNNEGQMIPVSVVVPCFRCSKIIDRAIASVAQQTTKPAEVILVDDCSEDGTLEKLRDLATHYPEGWVKIIALPHNGGPGNARNEGVKVSTQPLVAFLDADDSWHPQKVSIQYEWMSRHPEVMLTGHPSARYSEQDETKEILIEPRARKVQISQLLRSNVFSPRSIMFRRDLPVLFDNQKRYMEDHWWLMQIAFAGYSIVELDLPMAFTYKADFGEDGLSKRLWKMEKSELDNYWRLAGAGKISNIFLLFISFYSLLKYVRRIFISQWRHLLGVFGAAGV